VLALMVPFVVLYLIFGRRSRFSEAA